MLDIGNRISSLENEFQFGTFALFTASVLVAPCSLSSGMEFFLSKKKISLSNYLFRLRQNHILVPMYCIQINIDLVKEKNAKLWQFCCGNLSIICYLFTKICISTNDNKNELPTYVKLRKCIMYNVHAMNKTYMLELVFFILYMAELRLFFLEKIRCRQLACISYVFLELEIPIPKDILKDQLNIGKFSQLKQSDSQNILPKIDRNYDKLLF